VTSAREIGMLVNSLIAKFFTRTERLAGRNRRPLHALHSEGDM